MRTEELTDFGLGIRVHDFDPTCDADDQLPEIQRLLYQYAILLIRDVTMEKLFCDMRRVIDRLPADLRTAHLRNYTMPLVRRHSISGHRTLVLNEWHMPWVVGMAEPESGQLLSAVFQAVRVRAGAKVHRRIIINGPF